MTYDALLELLRTRRSVRRFRPQVVPRVDLDRLVEAARWAPSNHNRQPWKFVFLESPAAIAALAEAVRQQLGAKIAALPPVAGRYAEDFLHHALVFAGAPVVMIALHKRPVALSAPLLAGLVHPELVSGEPLSVAMAVQSLLLAAHALGLGTCVLTAPLLAGDALRVTMSVPEGYEVTCLVALGYPDEAPSAPRRKELAHVMEIRTQ